MNRLKQMIRWRFILPRLAILALLVLFCSFALAPVVCWVIVSTGQAITGAAVEIGEVQTSVVRTELVLRDVRIANPSRPMKNALAADSARFDLSTSALLRRKYIVQDGSVHGLRFATPRITSGTLPEAESDNETGEPEESPDEPLDLTWLAEMGGDAYERLSEEFETVRLCEEMLEAWPARYAELEARTDTLAQRAKLLKKQIQNFAKNNKRQPTDALEMEAEIRDIHQQSQTLRKQIGNLLSRLNDDRLRIDAAQQRDRAKIRQIVFEQQLDAETISRYLLREELAAKIRTALDWLAWGRDYIPRRVPETKPTRGHGLDVLFPGGRKLPAFLIQRLHLDGELELNGQPLPFAGTATNFTSDPVLLGQPAIVRLQTTDAARIEVLAQFDRRGPTDRTLLSIDCPDIAQSQRQLGSPNQFALVVSPGRARFHGEFALVGNELQGEVTFLQDGVRIEPLVGAKLGGDRVARYLADSLAAIDKIEGRLLISGTPRKPKLSIESALGGQIAVALRQVGEQEIAHQRQRLESQLAKLAETRSADLLARVAGRQQQLAAKLGLTDESVAALKKELVQRVGIPNQFLGKELPVGKFFK